MIKKKPADKQKRETYLCEKEGYFVLPTPYFSHRRCFRFPPNRRTSLGRQAADRLAQGEESSFVKKMLFLRSMGLEVRKRDQLAVVPFHFGPNPQMKLINHIELVDDTNRESISGGETTMDAAVMLETERIETDPIEEVIITTTEPKKEISLSEKSEEDEDEDNVPEDLTLSLCPAQGVEIPDRGTNHKAQLVLTTHIQNQSSAATDSSDLRKTPSGASPQRFLPRPPNSPKSKTMKEVLASIPGFSAGRPNKTNKKLSTAEQVEQTKKDRYIDLETPGSVLTQENLRAIPDKHTFAMLPPLYQYKLLQLLPEVDTVNSPDNGLRLSSSALTNEFFSKSCQEWSERLSAGELTPEHRQKNKWEADRERVELDPWKVKHFEPIWGQKTSFSSGRKGVNKSQSLSVESKARHSSRLSATTSVAPQSTVSSPVPNSPQAVEGGTLSEKRMPEVSQAFEEDDDSLEPNGENMNAEDVAAEADPTVVTSLEAAQIVAEAVSSVTTIQSSPPGQQKAAVVPSTKRPSNCIQPEKSPVLVKKIKIIPPMPPRAKQIEYAMEVTVDETELADPGVTSSPAAATRERVDESHKATLSSLNIVASSCLVTARQQAEIIIQNPVEVSVPDSDTVEVIDFDSNPVIHQISLNQISSPSVTPTCGSETSSAPPRPALSGESVPNPGQLDQEKPVSPFVSSATLLLLPKPSSPDQTPDPVIVANLKTPVTNASTDSAVEVVVSSYPAVRAEGFSSKQLEPTCAQATRETLEYALENKTSTSNKDSHGVNKEVIRLRTKGGQKLLNWAMENFEEIDKTLLLVPHKDTVCSAPQCGQHIKKSDAAAYCHELPFHGKCLTQVPGDDGRTKLKCLMCVEKKCFTCGRTDDSPVKCSKCELRFHVNCLKPFPQAQIQSETGPITCPLHFCHTCIAEHHIMKKVRNYKVGKSSLRCIKCPTSYHRACIPASCFSSLMPLGLIICPRHQSFQSSAGSLRVGCFNCNRRLVGKGKPTVVNCIKCPLSYHLDCVVDRSIFEGNDDGLKVYMEQFECDPCLWAWHPLPGQAVWCEKPGHGFWPARIQFPQEMAARGKNKAAVEEFSVVLFGAERSYYDQARYTCVVPLDIASYDVLKSVQVHAGDSEVTTAYEEGTYFMALLDSYRSKILQPPEPVYKKIERNVYRIVKPRAIHKRLNEMAKCSCSEDKSRGKICQFGSGCLNRESAIECTEKTCGDSSRCTNRMFSNYKSQPCFDKIVAFPTAKKGWGVRTIIPLKKGDFVIEYLGEVIPKNLYQWRLNRKDTEDALYFLELDTNLYIDAEYMGNLSRLINHSCQPNCCTEKYISQGKQVVGIFAKCDIRAGTELTFDYDFEYDGNEFPCCCEAKGCRGYISRLPQNKIPQNKGETREKQSQEDQENVWALKQVSKYGPGPKVFRGSFECDVCGKWFRKESDFIGHKRDHEETMDRERKVLTVNGIHSCSLCGKTGNSRNAIRLHLQRHHNPPVFCHHCGNPFTDEEVLKRHIDTQHLLTKKQKGKCRKLVPTSA